MLNIGPSTLMLFPLNSISIKGLFPFVPGDGFRDVLSRMDDCINIVVALRDGMQVRGGFLVLVNASLPLSQIRSRGGGNGSARILP